MVYFNKNSYFVCMFNYVCIIFICKIFFQNENPDGAEDVLSDIKDTLQLDDTNQQPMKRSAASFLNKNKITKRMQAKIGCLTNEMRTISELDSM